MFFIILESQCIIENITFPSYWISVPPFISARVLSVTLRYKTIVIVRIQTHLLEFVLLLKGKIPP